MLDAEAQEMPSSVPKVALSVLNLRYSPTSQHRKVQKFLVNAFHGDEAANLENVTFCANGGELMGVLAPDDAERRTLMELIANRRQYGEFDGEVRVSQSSRASSDKLKKEFVATSAFEPMAFVPRDAVSLYLPGLTYYETLKYAARLRMQNSRGLSSSEMANQREHRIADILEVMNLTWCKDRVIAERPTARGQLGGELRKILIAVEIISLPPVILLADITEGLDSTVSMDIVHTLRELSRRGHTVVSSFSKIFPQELSYFDKVTLISRGYSIFSSSPENVNAYFSSINFALAPDTDVAEFLLDVGNGTERPIGERTAPESSSLQASFEQSDYYDQFRLESASDSHSSSILSTKRNNPNGLFNIGNALTVLERALYCKLKEKEVLRKSFGASVGLSLFFGYFCWKMGSSTDTLLDSMHFPRSETSTLTSCLYLSTAIQVGLQVINVHIINQKQKVFRYERESGVCSLPSFLFASIISELPFAILFSLIYSVVVYYMCNLGNGFEDLRIWSGILLMSTVIGLLTVLLFTSNLRAEIAVRDCFLFCLITMIWTGGFMYPQSTLNDWVIKVSNINPLRWLFQSVMVWQWEGYPDSQLYLQSYNYQNYNKSDIWMISLYFSIFGVAMYAIGLLRVPRTLQRIKYTHQSSPSRESQAEADLKFMRKVDIQKPKIISRDSSFSTGAPRLSSQASTMPGKGIERGPRVSFVNLAYQVPHRKSPLGKKSIIHSMSGMFDWGKLGVILGAPGSGKSSLLQILGGQTLGSNAELQGNIYHDDVPLEELPLLPWQKCAFIEALDEHFRDLTVQDILTYGMLLRTVDALSDNEVQENVKRAMTLLQLDDVAHTKAKKLTSGEQRRLTIAEDIVHGPHLIMIDEPITNLNARESSIIMTQAVRELVNQDRTVIITLHQPSAAVFELCDTLALLSKGRMIYMGPASEASAYFIDSPSLPLRMDAGYENPADFLCDISNNIVRDFKDEIADATRLENSYKASAQYMLFQETQLKAAMERSGNSTGLADTQNPMRLSVGSNDNDTLDKEKSSAGGLEWRYASSVDNRVRSQSLIQPSAKPAASPPEKAPQLIRWFLIPLLASLHEMRTMNARAQLRKAYVLNRRAFFALYKREKLVIGTTIMYVYLAVFTCIILKSDQENNAGVVTPIAMFGAFLLLISQLQYVFYLFNNQRVFLKEHSRGLYSAYLRWLVEGKPLMLLRFFQGLLYGVIIHEWVGLQGGARGVYFYMMIVLITLGCTMLVETVVSTLPDLRTAYGSLTFIALILFVFSGLIFKPDIYPSYLAPWLPSISIIRWFAQGIIINEFEDNLNAFPTPFYNAYLSLFGWGGKTKWYCMNMVVLNMIVFKALSLLVSWKAVIADKGKRGMRRKEIEERIY